MPRNSGGIYSLPPVYLATPGETIMTDQHNSPLEDIANGLTESLPRSGSAPMTGDLKMGGQRVTGLGAPVADTDAARKVDINIPAASETVAGKVELATAAETITGTDTTRAVHPAGAAAAIDAAIGSLGAGATMPIADQAAAVAGTDNGSLMTPLRAEQHMLENAIGWGQTRQNVKSSRVAGSVYTNGTGRPIMVEITVDQGSGPAWSFKTGPDTPGLVTVAGSASSGTVFLSMIVLAGYSYQFIATSGSPNIVYWFELR